MLSNFAQNSLLYIYTHILFFYVANHLVKRKCPREKNFIIIKLTTLYKLSNKYFFDVKDNFINKNLAINQLSKLQKYKTEFLRSTCNLNSKSVFS